MDAAAGREGPTIELEFVKTIRYIDLYMQQKMDLFLQHYVLEPVEFLFRQIMFLSVIVTLLAAGTIILIIGVVLYLALFVPLWAALLIMGVILFGMGIIIATMLLSNKIVLKTPIGTEMLHDE
jgi:hypothetical protein